MSKRRTLNMTPKQKGRKSLLGFTSAAAKLRPNGGGRGGETPLEKKRLTFSAAKGSASVSRSALPKGSRTPYSRSSSIGVKDTRPLTSKLYQRVMVDEIIEFLNESGYPHPVNVKLLSSPTAKEFTRIFEHLYNFIIPNFSLNPKKYCEDIPMLMQFVNFPFRITKSTMYGIGSLHGWPNLLGVLHWLVELIKLTNSIDTQQILFHPSLHEEPGSMFKQLFLDYSAVKYKQYLLGEEDFIDENNLCLRDGMAIAGCKSKEEMDGLELDVLDLKEEFNQLENEPDILSGALKQKAELDDMITQTEQKIEELHKEFSCLQQKHVHYSSQLKEEGLIVELGEPARQAVLKRKSGEIEKELERLNIERERLEERNDEKEVKFSRLYDDYSVAQNEYNDIATRIKTNPHIKQFIGEKSIILNFSHSADNLDEFKNYLKPLLSTLSHDISDYRYKLEAEKIGLERELDEMKADYSTKKDIELVVLQDKLERIEKEYENNKDIVEKKFSHSFDECKQVENLLDQKQKEANELLEKERMHLATKKKECDSLHEKHLLEQDLELKSLLEFGQKVTDFKKFVDDQIDAFNDYLRSEIENVREEQKQIESMGEEKEFLKDEHGSGSA